ncbi:MAG: coat protein [Rhodospirillales bacterium]|nr:coat protein [Rhodospirillales bacterium]
MPKETLHTYPNKKLFAINGGKYLRDRYDEMLEGRFYFNRVMAALRSEISNNAALLPRDAWREVDDATMRVLREDEGQVYMADLMPLARGVDISKNGPVYRRSTAVNSNVNITMTGQTTPRIDEADYSYKVDLVPPFEEKYRFTCSKWMGIQSENFDGLADKQEKAVANLRQKVAQYVLNGDDKIKVKNYRGYGIKNHPATNMIDLDSSGLNIDLTSYSTSSDNIEQFFVRDVQKILHDNLVRDPINIYISPEINRRFGQSYSRSAGFKAGTLMEFLEELPFIASIKKTYELSGNELFAFPLMSKYIRPLIGQAVSTIAIPRLDEMHNYHFKVFQSMGLEIREHAKGCCGVIYATGTP